MKRAFTYIELLITLTILAVLFVPVMQLFSHSLYASSTSQDLMTATSLARWEMERIKNLNVTKEQLKEMGDSLYPPLDEGPIEMNEMKWRIKREIIKDTNPLEVRVHVYAVRKKKEVGEEEEVSEELYYIQEDKPNVTLVTLIENMFWEEIKPIK
jgi:prepilin-type N-terminal cleavage/methylation domain-containing protein